MNRPLTPRTRRVRIIRLTYRDAATLLRARAPGQAPPQAHRFSLGILTRRRRLIALAMLSRPADPELDDGLTGELTWWAAERHPRATRILLAATRRTARAMGYRRLINTPGASQPAGVLSAAGWRPLDTAIAPIGADAPDPTSPAPPVADEPRTRWQITLRAPRRRAQAGANRP